MAFIGNPPLNKGIGLFSQDTFTGDGSTTTFDLTNVAPDGGDNDIQVFVDNVRQQSGSSNAFTLGFDGSSELKRITFTTAPASGQSIYVLNPGTKNVQQITQLSDNSITTAKLQALSVERAKIGNDAINATKLADDAISEEHLDITSITGNTELSEAAAGDDVLLVYDTSAAALKKIQVTNINSAPTITSISPTNVTSGDGTGNHTFTITGTNFNSGVTAFFVNSSGTEVAFNTVTRNSSTQITAVIAKSSLLNSGEPFDISVANSNGQGAKLRNQVNVDASPIFTTAAGSLKTIADGARSGIRITVNATDPDSAGNVTFEIQSGSLPAGLSLTNEGSEGGTAVISGTASAVGSDTTSNFVLRAVDAASNTSSRSFSITVLSPQSTSFTSSGTFAVPAGLTAIDVLVVAGGGGGGEQHGGGGGAGGLIYFPSYPVTAGGTIAVTVGCGGAGGYTCQPRRDSGTDGQDSSFGASPSPGLGTGGVLTAKGGGGGGAGYCAPGVGPGAPIAGFPGGSGGGGGAQPGAAGGGATQPTQPGNSGAYGFGFNGGEAGDTQGGGGGGGGAGAVGANGGGGGPGTGQGGTGGVGKAYTIADGTTSVYYAGGGGGGGHCASAPNGGAGGQGGGGTGGSYLPGSPGHGAGTAGQANKGGGGGGSGAGANAAYTGGKGIVIVRF